MFKQPASGCTGCSSIVHTPSIATREDEKQMTAPHALSTLNPFAGKRSDEINAGGRGLHRHKVSL